MTRKSKILLIGGIIICSQLIGFHDYIFPFHWGEIKVKGLACTCPDETVVNGQLYLKANTPDSLKKYDLDYSEIYVTERPSSDFDPMGVDLYMIKGEIIGKDRVSEYDPWNPKFRVDKWRELDVLTDWAVKGLLIGQLIIIGILFLRKKE